MSTGKNPTNEVDSSRKTYSAKVQLKAQSSTGCAFCWFVLNLYPTLTSMSERDHSTYKAHLERSHGLCSEIQP